LSASAASELLISIISRTPGVGRSTSNIPRRPTAAIVVPR
jgi:hypothetical protein